MIEQKIESLLVQKFKEVDFQDCFLVETSLKGKKLKVYIDCDSGVTTAKCQKISRYLESFIDEENWLGERYTLEVSSPGIGRPLKFTRQYKKNIGRTAEVTLTDGSIKKGTIISASDELISLESKERIKEGKKKKTVKVLRDIPYNQINKTIIKIKF